MAGSPVPGLLPDRPPTATSQPRRGRRANHREYGPPVYERGNRCTAPRVSIGISGPELDSDEHCSLCAVLFRAFHLWSADSRGSETTEAVEYETNTMKWKAFGPKCLQNCWPSRVAIMHDIRRNSRPGHLLRSLLSIWPNVRITR
jgi:hypothetical protein